MLAFETLNENNFKMIFFAHPPAFHFLHFIYIRIFFFLINRQLFDQYALVCLTFQGDILCFQGIFSNHKASSACFYCRLSLAKFSVNCLSYTFWMLKCAFISGFIEKTKWMFCILFWQLYQKQSILDSRYKK